MSSLPASPTPSSASSYFSYPVTHVVSGLYRRFTDKDYTPSQNTSGALPDSSSSSDNTSSPSPIYTPIRTASPFQPPPLTPLTLCTDSSSLQQQLLSSALAEEIRLLIPPRLQLTDTWRLAYSLDRDGASLATLYGNCREFSRRSLRAGYVLVIRETSPAGTVFGAYMTDHPHPAAHYYATGECFLWRASMLRPPQNLTLPSKQSAKKYGEPAPADDINNSLLSYDQLKLADLPPPPSASTTTYATRSTTLGHDSENSSNKNNNNKQNGMLAPPDLPPIYPNLHSTTRPFTPTYTYVGTSASERMRFKAFPYSGVNDYIMFCETGFLSLGGGDGRYGLWIDSGLEKGVSESCQTFGNEPLSDDGAKFDILGVEVWYVGS